MKRLSIALLVLVALLLAIQPIAAQDGVTLTLWSRDSNQAFLRQLVDKWNESHTNQIEPTIIPGTEFVARVGTGIAAGEVPDLLPIDLIYAPAFAQAGQLTEIGEFAMQMPFYDQLIPAHIRLGTYDDGLYALPFAAEGSVLLYNKGLFEQAGLDPEQPPTNWQELYDAAVAINALGNDNYGFYFSGNCAGCNAFTFLPLIWASGGDVLSEDGTEATIDSDPVVRAALEFYRQLWTEGLVPPGAQADTGNDFFNAFARANIGMTGSGAFSNSLLKTDYPEIEFGIAFLPGQEDGVSSFAGGDLIAIPAGAQHVEEGFEFIEWVLSDEVQVEEYARSGQMPLRLDLAENKYFEEDPRLVTNAQAMGLGQTPYTFVYNELFNDPNGPWLQMFQMAIFEGDVDGAISTGQQRFTEILSQE
ncbi:MAG: sugar ABC transporter substrate-binding protein [Chloroflexi bacterium]|nr:sugar ABC transporter substrate-binding protein [Chloroflexota bacterium]